MKKTYLAGMGMITSIGGNSLMAHHTYRAEMSGYKIANYFTSRHKLVKLALVPDAALPPVVEELAEQDCFNFRGERLLQMSHIAAVEAMRHHQSGPVSLFMSAPEHYQGITNPLNASFPNYLKTQSGLAIAADKNRMIYTGRSGGLEALKYANYCLHDLSDEFVLIGGADSGQDSDLLTLLDSHARISSELSADTPDGFVYGEGAGFLLLTSNPNKALNIEGYRFSLTKPGFGIEPGHLYSDKPYLGDGLDQAFKHALSVLPSELKIKTIYSTMNGENFWAKELGVAVSRSTDRFDDPAHEHPADCHGDLGAASAPVLIALACLSSAFSANKSPSLVYCSSDRDWRASTCVIPEAVTQ